MHKLRVGVMRGGPSNEYEISLGSGAVTLSSLRTKLDHLYDSSDILIDREGRWHMDGLPCQPESLFSKVDVVFNALHGNYGEDGKVQALLEAHGVPFTGSGSLASAIGMSKVLAKKVLQDHGIKSPYWLEVSADEIKRDLPAVTKRLFSTFVFPAVIKPSSSGSSVGISIARTAHDLSAGLIEAASHGETVLLEEFIPGVEATCGVIEHFRGEELYALPPIEIRSHTGFFDYEAKYAGKSEEIVPATFAESVKKELESLARQIHRLLGLRHYSRSDFIIHPRRGIYVLETNTLPGLTETSLIPKALRSVGSDVTALVDHLIKLAVRKV